MGEIGKVIAKDDNKVKVELLRTEACAKCKACTVGMKSETMVINCLNICNAKVNDKVEIMLEEENFLKAVAIMYGIPFMGFIFGVFAGYYGSVRLGLASNELISCCTGMVCVVVSFLWIKSNEEKWKKQNFVPKAIRIEESAK